MPNTKAPSKAIALLVETAVELHRKIKADLEKLEDIKSELRLAAERERVGDEMVEFSSEAGVATVCFVKDSVRLVRGADPKSLIDVIDDNAWNSLFIVKASLSPDFEPALALQSRSVQTKAKRLVEWVPNAPRVTLPK